MRSKSILLAVVFSLFLGIVNASALTVGSDARIDTNALNATNLTLSGFINASGDIVFNNGTSLTTNVYNHTTVAVTTLNTTYNYLWYNHTIIARDYLNTTYGAFWFNQSNLAVNLLNNTYNYLWYNHTTIAVTTLNNTYFERWYNYSLVTDTTQWQYNATTATVTLHNSSWGIGIEVNKSYNPRWYNYTDTTVTLHNASWINTRNASYEALNSSALLAFYLNGTKFDSLWNYTRGSILPFHSNANVTLGGNFSVGGSIFCNADTGNCGIGTAALSSPLDVKATGSSLSTGFIRVTESGTSNPSAYIGYGGAGFGGMVRGYKDGGTTIGMQLLSDGNSYFNGGNVGIATVQMNSTFHNNGNATFNGNISILGIGSNIVWNASAGTNSIRDFVNETGCRIIRGQGGGQLSVC